MISTRVAKIRALGLIAVCLSFQACQDAATPTVTTTAETTYAVTYKSNGGSGTVPDSASYDSGATVTVSSGSTLTYSGYSLAGWTTNTATTGTSASYAAGATFTLSEDVTLYAVWIPTTLDYNSSVTSIRLSGWSTEPTGAFTIPPGVTPNASPSFNALSGLTSVTIPSSVTSIGDRVFAACNSLSAVLVGATTPPALGENVFDSTLATFYVPSASLTAYKAATNWSAYSTKMVGY